MTAQESGVFSEAAAQAVAAADAAATIATATALLHADTDASGANAWLRRMRSFWVGAHRGRPCLCILQLRQA